MKTLFWKTDDRVFDNLLRSHIGRSAGSTSPCPEFDPDLASAYVERSLYYCRARALCRAPRGMRWVPDERCRPVTTG